MNQNYSSVTEIAGDDVSTEQVERLCHRYFWAGEYCKGKDVLEVACGNGQGLGYLASIANSLHAGDIDKDLVLRAKKHYKQRIPIDVMDAQKLPFDDNSLDVILLFEAIYYIPDVDKFMSECRRVLRKGGHVLIVSANKDLYDFNPSPYSHTYFGTIELTELMKKYGFSSSLFGYWPQEQSSKLQTILRPVKKIVVASGLMPKTMAGKKLLKRLVFGKLIPMPAEVEAGQINFAPPISLNENKIERDNKVIYCAGKLLD